MNKRYVVRLSDEERGVCQTILKNLKGSSQKFHRAQILLKADVAGPGWSDAKIAEAFNCRVQTIENLRKRLATESFELYFTRLWMRLFSALVCALATSRLAPVSVSSQRMKQPWSLPQALARL